MAKDDKELGCINTSHLRADLIDPDKLVKVNDLKEVTNPIFFAKNGQPTSDGLLSNEIFGITHYDRANTYAYIELHETFINPLIYKLWCKVDKNVKACVHGIKNFSIKNGELVEDDEGDNGINFLIKNIEQLKLRRTDSKQRDMSINVHQEDDSDSCVL